MNIDLTMFTVTIPYKSSGHRKALFHRLIIGQRSFMGDFDALNLSWPGQVSFSFKNGNRFSAEGSIETTIKGQFVPFCKQIAFFNGSKILLLSELLEANVTGINEWHHYKQIENRLNFLRESHDLRAYRVPSEAFTEAILNIGNESDISLEIGAAKKIRRHAQLKALEIEDHQISKDFPLPIQQQYTSKIFREHVPVSEDCFQLHASVVMNNRRKRPGSTNRFSIEVADKIWRRLKNETRGKNKAIVDAARRLGGG